MNCNDGVNYDDDEDIQMKDITTLYTLLFDIISIIDCYDQRQIQTVCFKIRKKKPCLKKYSG